MKRIPTLFLFFSASYTFATVEYLTVNHITKELFWAESDTNEEGFIGWEAIAEGRYHEDSQKYEDAGYTEFPYKLDILVGLFILLPMLLLFIRGKKRRSSRLQNKK